MKLASFLNTLYQQTSSLVAGAGGTVALVGDGGALKESQPTTSTEYRRYSIPLTPDNLLLYLEEMLEGDTIPEEGLLHSSLVNW